MAVGFRWRWPALSRRRLSPACRGSVSSPCSSNRTCGFPASGSPTGFTARHTVDRQCRLVSRDDTVARDQPSPCGRAPSEAFRSQWVFVGSSPIPELENSLDPYPTLAKRAAPRATVRSHGAKRSLAGLLIAKSARRRGEIAMQTAGSGPDAPSTAVFATLPVTASGHPGNLAIDGRPASSCARGDRARFHGERRQ